ncbi:MAG: rod shape-determining protein MreC [Defluviitaleaceae bacterium]|nr:rod shape-determining protein MreC [Defluviitaleaceae bacterium]
MKILRNKKTVFLLVGIIICILLMAFTVGNRTSGFVSNVLGVVVVPIQNVMTGVGGWFSDIRTYFTDMNYLVSENQRLNSEMEELLLALNRLELLEAHNYQLTQLLEMDQRYPRFETVAADIISRDNNNWNTRFIINRGYTHGVEQNMVVVAQGALVGNVTAEAHNFSQVTPIIDDASAVSAAISRSGAIGFARGDIMLGSQGLLRFETDIDADILEGDELMTSALGTIFPPGIHIGIIVEITEPSPQGLIAIVQPLVSFDNLNAVLVITGVSEDMDYDDYEYSYAEITLGE